MFNRYFQQELAYLKELGAEFSKAHPALAPMLIGPSADPDVERLLEGVAFLSGLLRGKLDDEFPEIIHELMGLISPHYLRPIPSATIVAFSPKPALKNPATIPAGIHLGSVPVEGTSCLFKTCYDVEIHPLRLLEASFAQPPGKPPVINLLLELQGLNVSEWEPRGLRFYLNGDYAAVTDLYFLLRHHLKSFTIKPLDGGSPACLSAEFLTPVGFSSREGLFPYPAHAFPGYQVLQEYFILPEKFLFFELVGWDRWHDRGEGSRLEITLELDDLPFPPPKVKKEHFLLFATPAINIFPHDADPIRLDHRRTQYLVRPTGTNPSHRQVYSVERVVGYVQGTAEERVYLPFEFFHSESQNHPVYHLNLGRSAVDQSYSVYLSVPYPQESGPPVAETLSIDLLCTNSSLPEHLQVGDISVPTGTSPEYAEFRNLRPPTAAIVPPLGTNLLWRLLAHLSLNYLSLAKPENLRALLDLYVFPEGRHRPSILANRKRIAGIEDIEARGSDRLVSGIPMRGQEIKLKMRRDHFASQGDLFLFGCVLDYFLGCYGSMNTYTQLIVEETLKGDLYRWPARLGEQPLV